MAHHDDAAHATHQPLHARPREVMQYLQGVSYPTRKPELLAAAKRNSAPNDVLRALEIMYGEIFQTPRDVEENLKSSEARDQ